MALGSIIGGAMNIGGSIFGGISASRAMKNVRKNIEAQKQKNEDWYNRRYNEDATQRADAQSILTQTMDAMRRSNQQAAGAQAVMGGTDESVAATKMANAQALGEAATNIAISGERRKDAIENQYLATDAQLNSQLNELEMQRAGQITNAANNVAKAAADMAGTF